MLLRNGQPLLRAAPREFPGPRLPFRHPGRRRRRADPQPVASVYRERHMRPRPLLLGLPPPLSAGRRRPALALVLVLGLAMSPIVAASGIVTGARSPAALAAPATSGPRGSATTGGAAPRNRSGSPAEYPSARAAALPGPSAEASISADGRYVAFSSISPDLVAGDTNASQDVVRPRSGRGHHSAADPRSRNSRPRPARERVGTGDQPGRRVRRVHLYASASRSPRRHARRRSRS